MCGSSPCQGPPPLQSLPLWDRHQLLLVETKDRMHTDQGWFLPVILGKVVSPFFCTEVFTILSNTNQITSAYSRFTILLASLATATTNQFEVLYSYEKVIFIWEGSLNLVDCWAWEIKCLKIQILAQYNLFTYQLQVWLHQLLFSIQNVSNDGHSLNLHLGSLWKRGGLCNRK